MEPSLASSAHRHEARGAAFARWMLFLVAVAGLLLTTAPVALR